MWEGERGKDDAPGDRIDTPVEALPERREFRRCGCIGTEA